MSLEKARKIHAKRSQRAKTIDLKKQHNKQLEPTEENVSRWSKNPRRSDIIGVDDKSVIVAKKAAPKAKPKKATPKKAEPKKEAVRRPKAAPKKDMESWEELTKPVKKYDQWQFPSDEELKKEFYIEHELKGKKIFKDEKEFVGFTKKYGKSLIIGEDYDKTIANRTRTDTPQALMSILKTYKSWPEFRNEKTTKNLYRRFQQNLPLDMPIVIREKSGYEKVFSGNTRMDVAFQLGVEPKIIVLKLEQLEQYRQEQKEGEGLKAMPKDTSYTKRKETAEKLGKPSVVPMAAGVPKEDEEEGAGLETILHSNFQANQVQKFIDETDMHLEYINLKNMYANITNLLKELDSGKKKKTKKFLDSLDTFVELYNFDLLKLVDELGEISIGQGLKMTIALQLSIPEEARKGAPMMKYIAYDPMMGFIIDDRVEPNDQVEISKVYYSLIETYNADKDFGTQAQWLNKLAPIGIASMYNNLESIFRRFLSTKMPPPFDKFWYKGIKKIEGGDPYHVYYVASSSKLVMLTGKKQPDGIQADDTGSVAYDPDGEGVTYKIEGFPDISEYYGAYADDVFTEKMGSYDFIKAIITKNCIDVMKKYGLYVFGGDKDLFLVVGSDGKKTEDGQPKISGFNMDYYKEVIQSILDLGNQYGLESWNVFRNDKKTSKPIRVQYGQNYFVLSPVLFDFEKAVLNTPGPKFVNQAVLAEGQYILEDEDNTMPDRFLKSINQVKKVTKKKVTKTSFKQAADVDFDYGKKILADPTNQGHNTEKTKKLREILPGKSEKNTQAESNFVYDLQGHFGSSTHKSKIAESKWRQLAKLKEQNPAVLDPSYSVEGPPVEKVYRAGTFKYQNIPTKGWKFVVTDSGEYYFLDWNGIVESSFDKTLLSMSVDFKKAKSFEKGASTSGSDYLPAIIESPTKDNPNLIFSYAHSNMSSGYLEFEVVNIGDEFLVDRIFVGSGTLKSMAQYSGVDAGLRKWARDVYDNHTKADFMLTINGKQRGGKDFYFRYNNLAKVDIKGINVIDENFKKGGKVKRYMRGGETAGPSHEKGGIPAVNKSTGQMLELEGGEGVINKAAMDSSERVNLNGKDMTVCEAASDLNQRAGNGRPMNC